MVRVRGEMMSIKGDLLRLGPLEVKVDLMLEKLSMLERMEKRLQKMGEFGKGLLHEGNPIELSYCHS